MVARTSPWQELCRFDDAELAQAVATSIAAMEFPVRLRDRSGTYVIQVFGSERDDLAEVLDEIVDEQQEFDRLLAERANRPGVILAVITLTGATDLLLLVVGLIDW